MDPRFYIYRPGNPLMPLSAISYTSKRPFLRSHEPIPRGGDLADAITASSDPVYFSNNETPDAENHNGGVKRRKKRTYKGTWRDIKSKRESSTEKSPWSTRMSSLFQICRPASHQCHLSLHLQQPIPVNVHF